MIVVWTDEAAQSYIAQARSSGRPRPSRSSSDCRDIAGEDRGGRRALATFPAQRVVQSRDPCSPPRAVPPLVPGCADVPTDPPGARRFPRASGRAPRLRRPPPTVRPTPPPCASGGKISPTSRASCRAGTRICSTPCAASSSTARSPRSTASCPTLARHQVIVELARIVARVGDGHTNVAPTRDPKIGFHTYPVKLYFFKDGLFVRSASRDAGRSGRRQGGADRPDDAPRRPTRRCGS